MPGGRSSGTDGVTRAGLVALAAGRIAIGVAVWVRPGVALRLLGFDRAGPGSATVARIAGTRDLALGGLQLAWLSSPARSRALAHTAAGVDAGDAVAFTLHLAGGGDRRAATIGAASAAGAALTGAWLAMRLR